MAEYFVRWETPIIAATPREAARHCIEIMRDASPPARYFTVIDRVTGVAEFVDLMEDAA